MSAQRTVARMVTNPPASTGSFDSAHFRSVLGHFPTGVTVVTGVTGDAGRYPVGFTIGSFTSVSLDPPLVGFLPQMNSETWAQMAPAGRFCVNVLSHDQADLCWKFAKSAHDANRFADVDWRMSPGGAPILERAVAWIDCLVTGVYEMGDHFFVLGAVTALEADASNDGGTPHPLLFFKGGLGRFLAES